MPSPDISLYSVQAVVILDNDGKRIFAKYYQPPYNDANYTPDKLITSVKEQTSFEKGLFAKTNKQNADVILYESKVIVYKQSADISLYIVGGMEENEAMLYQVVLGLRDAFDILLKHSVDKRTLLENYDIISLAVDESIDSGIILEVDPVIIASRVSKAPTNEPSINNIDLSEQGLMNVYQFARGKLSEKLRQQFQ